MATGDQIRTLIKSHFEDDHVRFSTVALQIAAHEARQGHLSVADEIKKLVDTSKAKVVKLRPFNDDLNGLILEISPKVKLPQLIASPQILSKIQRILLEFKQKDKLSKHGLDNRRKILLSGSPGTGKTMTAAIFANELQLPLYVILMDKLVTKFMGETSAKLRHLFDSIQERQGVYLFDEFDAIGGERGMTNDVGEMRRILNSFLQMIEQDTSKSVIIAATNNIDLLDQALFRRFDDVIRYNLPLKSEAIKLIENKLGKYKGRYKLDTLKTDKLSHAEITQACLDAIKHAILNDKKQVDLVLIKQMLNERITAYKSKPKTK
ncbi:ATP-binding protein [Panacibacter sp. DH6]|uniref:ATP-binding protein n=1 Tax=Panacibacter microcysteis TaxID=2793269 RepID=A0A931E811_9BACT|nr:ATP-binding protein [Panacibacter microcysteis]MBG9375421.1 ATP-binding protein [Panacibacter microcysteis]